MYKRDIIDIIRSVVSSMTFPVTIQSVIADGGNYVLTVDDIYHAQPTFAQTIDGTLFKIVDIDADANTITLSTTDVSVDITFFDTHTSFDLYTPYFYHGTPIATNDELQDKKRAKNKTPMVWFLEQFEETFFEYGGRKERDSSIRLFFLTQAKHKDWQTDDAYHNAIQPMHRLAENFIDALKAYKEDCRLVFNTEDEQKLTIKRRNYAQFGVYISMKGMEENLFADQLSGCEIQFSPSLSAVDC